MWGRRQKGLDKYAALAWSGPSAIWNLDLARALALLRLSGLVWSGLGLRLV
jgi:hypothetical protein